MNNKREKSYPFCFCCSTQLDPKKGDGWEKIITAGRKGKIFFICPDCMLKTNIGRKYEEMQNKLHKLCKVINELLDLPKGKRRKK